LAENFADRLISAIRIKRAPVCVGIDPVYARLPAEIAEHRALNDEQDVEAALDAVLEFCRRVIRTVAPYVPAVKLNSAFFERYYAEGIEGYYELVQEAAERGLVVIGDVKRCDVAHSAEMYARSALAEPDFMNAEQMVAPDAVTVTPYVGADGIEPFVKIACEQGKGVFVLVRTSNPSAEQVQGFQGGDGITLAEHVARLVADWSDRQECLGRNGYSCVGAVVAPVDRDLTYKLRALMPRCLFLVPGYGAQGLTSEDVVPCFKSDGTGALITASRSVIYAYEQPKYLEMYASEWDKCVEQACKDFVAQIAAIVNAL